jgi:hypothetical protein
MYIEGMAMANTTQISEKVDQLKAELPRISFGYLGDCERWGDDRSWYVFLPHYSRIGTYGDMVSLGKTEDVNTLPVNWSEIEAKVRQRYAADSNRIQKVKLNTSGVLTTESGAPVLSAQYFAPKFTSEDEAEKWLESNNYPATVKDLRR